MRMYPSMRVIVGITALLLASLTPLAATAQDVLSAPAFIERPVVRVVRIGTTVSAPASILAPPMIPRVPAMRPFDAMGAAIEKDIRRIRTAYLGSHRNPDTRRNGFESLAQYTQGHAVSPLLEVLLEEDEDVRAWLFDHLANRVESGIGQGALTHLAIYHEDPALRAEAAAFLKAPATDHARFHLDLALRSNHPEVVERTAPIVAQLDVREAIGDLILANAGLTMSESQRGPLAVVNVGEDVAFVSDYLSPTDPRRAGIRSGISPLPSLDRPVNLWAPRTDALFDDVEDPPVKAALLALADNVERDRDAQGDDLGHTYEQWHRWYNDRVVPGLFEE